MEIFTTITIFKNGTVINGTGDKAIENGIVAVVASTRNAARALGWENKLSTLEAGKLADLIVVKNIEYVMQGGNSRTVNSGRMGLLRIKCKGEILLFNGCQFEAWCEARFSSRQPFKITITLQLKSGKIANNQVFTI